MLIKHLLNFKFNIKPQTNHTAWQRFLSTGPIALLPLDENYSTLVWSIKKEHAKQLLDLPDDLFAQQINHAFVRVLLYQLFFF